MFLIVMLGAATVALAVIGPSYASVAKLIYALMVAATVGARFALRGGER